jgi:uncharacterized repeat protein (TIGR03803 family)
MSGFSGWCMAVLAASGLMAGNTAHATDASVLYSFRSGRDGAAPLGGLISVGGALYGTTSASSLANPGGTVFRLNEAGQEKVLYRFKGGAHDGGGPGGMLVSKDGAFFGTTSYGGGTACDSGLGCGTVFKLTQDGHETILHKFRGGNDGEYPYSWVTDIGGTLYGTTFAGGGTGCADGAGCGTVFRVTGSGEEIVLYRFKGGPDGAYPVAGLIPVGGVLYGTTQTGGAYGMGTVFSMTLSGIETVIYAFTGGNDGAYPTAGLTDLDGVLYGVTTAGGTGTACFGGCGTVFGIAPDGAETVLHAFGHGKDGAQPWAKLIHVNGHLYGTTAKGGTNGNGTVFKIGKTGVETVLHSFHGGPDGYDPQSSLVDLNGALFGATLNGGAFGVGTVFQVQP